MMPRKSLEEHKLTGTRPQWVLPDNPHAGGITSGRLKMPKTLSEHEQGIWKQIFGPLHRRGTMTRADSPAAIVLVKMWCRWETVSALALANPCAEVSWLDKSGETHVKTVEHPASKMSTALEGRILRALAEFSATPASRDKTKIPAPPAPKVAPEPVVETVPTPEPDDGVDAWINSPEMDALLKKE